MKDVFERIEARIVGLGEFLEVARRYRPLVERAETIYAEAMRVAARVRGASRGTGEGAGDDPEKLEASLADLLGSGHDALVNLLESEPYRRLVEAAERAEGDAVAALVPDVFNDVEPAGALGRLLVPVVGKRGDGILEPEAGVDAIGRAARDGIEPARGPGVGADETIRPIRLYEGADGLDAAAFLVVDGKDVRGPAFRAVGLGEVLVYVPRLAVPVVAGLRAESPDAWLEVRAGGYEEYRQRWRRLLEEKGFPVVTIEEGG